MSQLDQILGYLDRDGVSEVILAVGQPIQFRRNGQLVPLTNAQLTRVQVAALIANTQLATVFGKRGEGDMQIGKRSLRVAASGTTDAPSLTIAHAVAAKPAAPAAPPERARRPSKLGPTLPRAQTADHVRTKAPSKQPPNKLTKSDIKFATAPALEPPGSALELEPPGHLNTRTPASLSLDLEDDSFELPHKKHAGSTPAIDAAFAGPKSPHAGSTPAIDAAFGLGSKPPTGLDVLGPRAPIAAVAPVAFPAPPVVSQGSANVPPALRALLEEAGRKRASDLHIIVNRPVCARVLGELTPLRPDVLDAKAVESLLLPVLDERGRAQLERAGYSDLALELPSGARLRTNIARCAGGLRGTFRIARPTPPTLDELGLPKDLAKVVAHHQGLVVIAGPSGAGKTTTLAALVDLINSASAFHIITVEDPIEIVYPRKAAVVSQREVGAHTKSFAAALKGSLREDPDVIVIGELRDRETVEIALTAAETGHLVLATMSTPSAAKTIDRLVDMFPPDDQSQVRASIAGALRAIVSQRLLATTSGTDVVAAVELVTGVLPLATMIRDDKLFQLPSLMQRGRAFGMIRLDDSLAELVRAGKISSDTALAASENRKDLATRLQSGTSAIPTLPRKS